MKLLSPIRGDLFVEVEKWKTNTSPIGATCSGSIKATGRSYGALSYHAYILTTNSRLLWSQLYL